MRDDWIELSDQRCILAGNDSRLTFDAIGVLSQRILLTGAVCFIVELLIGDEIRSIRAT